MKILLISFILAVTVVGAESFLEWHSCQAENKENKIKAQRIISETSSKLFAITHDDDPTNDAQAMDEAIRQYKQAMRLDPKSAEAHDKLGEVYLDRDMIDKAIKEFEKAIKLDTNYADAYRHLGYCYEQKGWLTKARQAYEKSLEIKPQYMTKSALENLEITESVKAIGDEMEKLNKMEEALKQMLSSEEVPEKKTAIISKKQITKSVILPLVGLVILLVLIVAFIKRRKRK